MTFQGRLCLKTSPRLLGKDFENTMSLWKKCSKGLVLYLDTVCLVNILFTYLILSILNTFSEEESDKPYRGDILLKLYAKKHGLEGGLVADDETLTAHRKFIAPKLLKLGALKPYFTDILNVADDTVANFNEGCN